jgi:predicted nucleic acid-binding protein
VIAYLDSSVLLWIVLREAGQLSEWRDIATGVVSALAEVECLRTLDRVHLEGGLSDRDLVRRRATVFHLLEAVDLVDISRAVLARATQPFPTPVRTLDATHLATALAWRETHEPGLVMATHDRALAEAAHACGFFRCWASHCSDPLARSSRGRRRTVGCVPCPTSILPHDASQGSHLRGR